MRFIEFIKFLLFSLYIGMVQFLLGLPVDSIWNKFTSKYGENFVVHWNDRAITPHKLYGQGIILKPTGFTKSSEVIESVNSFIEANSYLFNIDVKDLKIDRVDSLRQEEYYLIYRQYYHTLPVLGNGAVFTVTKGGEIISLGIDCQPDMNVALESKVSKESAINIAEQRLETTGAVQVHTATLCICPLEMDSVISYYLVWDISIACSNEIVGSRNSKRILIDAVTGKILKEFDLIFHGNWTIDGHVMGVIRPEYRYDSPDCRLFPFEKLIITLDPGYYHIFYTNAVGYYYDQGIHFAINKSIRIKLAGFFISEMWKKWFDAIPPWIHNAPIASHFYTFPSAGSRHYDYIWSESQGSQEEEAINAYWHTTRIGKIIMDEPFWYYGAGYPIKVWVSEYDGESPYYNPSTEELWFTRYYNYHWALSSDCIYHEYGHHIIWNVYGKDFIGGTNPTSQSRAMEEGFADYLACTINDVCLSGEDVPIPGSLPRNLDNQLMYPYNIWSDHRWCCVGS